MLRTLTVAAAGLAGLVLPAVPASAATPPGGHVTFEEGLVCFFSPGNTFQLGQGTAITTPSGRVVVVCRPLP